MSQTLAQKLTSVQAAIAAIEGGNQSYMIDGVTFTKANLATLYTREERIEKKISQALTGGRTVGHL